MTDAPFLPRVEEFLDCTGKLLQFRLTQGPQADGVILYARQLDPEHPPGYHFTAWSMTLGDALGKLRRNIRDGIARRHLAEHPTRGLSLLTDGFSGFVDSGGVTIDGRHVPFDWIMNELQTYEGWQIELKIKDAAE